MTIDGDLRSSHDGIRFVLVLVIRCLEPPRHDVAHDGSILPFIRRHEVRVGYRGAGLVVNALDQRDWIVRVVTAELESVALTRTRCPSLRPGP